ncbi:MAG: hypothetical protein IRZ31_00995 [Thermogemmatispora sp.]|uniref:hypothetical protein n=1 Tax=Thermogemmatispora sp. TaxID=1968838 RepID=UPI002604B684|nr:hypothetical protein [Thermogemmatispora sp.]MBX5455447.1 hypothetical protein [Thermogemmatispora sp.]
MRTTPPIGVEETFFRLLRLLGLLRLSGFLGRCTITVLGLLPTMWTLLGHS